MSLKGAKSPTRGRKLRSTGTKGRARVGNGPKSIVELRNQLEERIRELAEARGHLSEALEQPTATSEVLQVISSSPGELQTVFDTMLEKATRICGASFGVLHLSEGDSFRTVATHNAPLVYVERRRRDPVIRDIPKNDPIERVRATRRVVEVADSQQEAAYRDGTPGGAFARETGARSMLLVPMLKDNGLTGIVAIYRLEVRPFTERQSKLVQNFAAQAVIAIENTRLLNELRESLQQQTATSEVLQVISSSPGDLTRVRDHTGERNAHL